MASVSIKIYIIIHVTVKWLLKNLTGTNFNYNIHWTKISLLVLSNWQNRIDLTELQNSRSIHGLQLNLENTKVCLTVNGNILKEIII